MDGFGWFWDVVFEFLVGKIFFWCLASFLPPKKLANVGIDGMFSGGFLLQIYVTRHHRCCIMVLHKNIPSKGP